MTNQETHPFKWFVPQNSGILIIGTFPPTARNWSYNFFYPNKLNLFWTIMSKVANEGLKYFSGEAAVEERKAILETLKGSPIWVLK